MKLFKIAIFAPLLILYPVWAVSLPAWITQPFKTPFVPGEAYPANITQNDYKRISAHLSDKRNKGLECILTETVRDQNTVYMRTKQTDLRALDSAREFEGVITDKEWAGGQLTATGNITLSEIAIAFGKNKIVIPLGKQTFTSDIPWDESKLILLGTCTFQKPHFAREAKWCGGISLAGLAALTYYLWPKN